jgi:hypothetical protein
MPELRTQSAGAKVTEKEYAEIEKLAESRGLKLGEWCRKTLLARVNGQEPRAAPPIAPATARSVLMAELSALRQSFSTCCSNRRMASPDGGGDATADRPGGFGQVEEGAGAALAGARVRRTTEQIIHSDSFSLWRW